MYSLMALNSPIFKYTVLRRSANNKPCEYSSVQSTTSKHLDEKYKRQAEKMKESEKYFPFQIRANDRSHKPTVPRRSANYKPTLWEYDSLQSITSKYTDERYMKQAEKLKENARHLLQGLKPLAQMELIDAIERLGLGRHFEKEIKGALDSICVDNKGIDEDLHATALCFRILRKHGYHVSQDVFVNFKNETGSFMATHSMDAKAMLSLYEASHFAFQGDTTLDEARDFTTKHLKKLKGHIDPNLAKKIEHALEFPLHWSVQRMEARWYIDFYEREEHMNSNLLEWAKLDFNIVQAKLQGELKDLSRWHMDIGLSKKLSFMRDRFVEIFLWTVGVHFEPEYEYSREWVSKLGHIFIAIDDIYDIYGSLDELELFTDAVDRWEISAMESLPEYMKITFFALYNTVHQSAYDILKEQGWNVVPYLKKACADLCKAYFVEAKWYHTGYIPTLEEYINNGKLSITIVVEQFNIYFGMKIKITKEALECLESYPNIVNQASILMRLFNDLGTSMDELARGDNPTCIQCYMHEIGVSEAIARVHIRNLISKIWKDMTEETIAASPLPKAFNDACVNMVRMTNFIYKSGDGDRFGTPDYKTKDRIKALLVKPIPTKET